jgi:membrane protease YdiL (CAAX protease family)
MARERSVRHDLIEIVVGYGLILLAVWLPTRPQQILSPVVLVVTFAIVVARCPSREALGFGWRGLVRSLWILPAAAALGVVAVLLARRVGTFHPLFHPDIPHIVGYVLWTIYQQVLLNDLFLPRFARLLDNEAAAIAPTALLFAGAHMPNLWLTAATLAWGVVACVLFRRYRNLYVLGLAQGLLGLCFAVCVPDSIHHHMRVGLGYLRYR